MIESESFVFVVRQRNFQPYNETLKTNVSASVVGWLKSRSEREPKSKNPNKDFVLTINGRRYELPKSSVWNDLEKHIEYCLELDRAFFDPR